MYTETAALYDLIYSSFKNYEAETDQLFALLSRIRPGLRTVLDIACGTGEHARQLRERHGLEVDGVDLDPAFVQIAQTKNPNGRFVHGDMTEFDLGRTYDAVMCLFSSIGYLRTIDRVTQAIARFRAHAAPGGVIVVEPWFPPGFLTDGFRATNVGERDGVRVERKSWTEVDGRRCEIHFEYDINDHGRIQHAKEVHELGLFTTDEMHGAFQANGLEVDYDAHGLIGRGLYVARVPA